MIYRVIPLDQIEDLIPRSSAYRQAAAVLFAQKADISGRPLTSLYGGHVGLLCTAGMLNGVFGEGETRHSAHWQSIRLVDRSEEEEDGTTVNREKERFSNELTAVAFRHAQRYALGPKPSREEEAPAALAEAGDSALRTSRIQARERNFDGSVRRAVEGEATAARPQRHAPNARGIHPRRKRGRCEDCRATRQDFAPI